MSLPLLLSPALIDHLQLFFHLGEVVSLTFTQLGALGCPWRYSKASPVPTGAAGPCRFPREPRRWPHRHCPGPERTAGPEPLKAPPGRSGPRARHLPVRDTGAGAARARFSFSPSRVSRSSGRAPHRSRLHERPRPRRALPQPGPRRQGRNCGRHRPPGPGVPGTGRGGRQDGRARARTPPALGAALTDRLAGT